MTKTLRSLHRHSRPGWSPSTQKLSNHPSEKKQKKTVRNKLNLQRLFFVGLKDKFHDSIKLSKNIKMAHYLKIQKTTACRPESFTE